MSSKEQSCMDNCARRFLESTQFVVKVGVAGGGGGLGSACWCLLLVGRRELR